MQVKQISNREVTASKKVNGVTKDKYVFFKKRIFLGSYNDKNTKNDQTFWDVQSQKTTIIGAE